MTVADNIRRIRKEKNLTQKQLGQRSGIAESTIRRYELGLLNPKFETMQKIADALGVTVYELTGEAYSLMYQYIDENSGINSLLVLLEQAGYSIIQVPCFFNHGDWEVKTDVLDDGSIITAAFNEKLQIFTRGCLNHKSHKIDCSTCPNKHFDNFIIEHNEKQIVLSIDEMKKNLNEIVKYTDYVFHYYG